MDKVYVSQVKEKDSIESYFIISDKFSGLDKNKKPYLSLSLKDKTGSINARLWDNVNEIEDEIKVGDVIHVKGRVQLFQNRKQMILTNVKIADEGSYNIDHLINENSVDSIVLMSELNHIVEQVSDISLRQLIKNTLSDPEIINLLKKAPAAKTIHHAYNGGLLEHIVSICKIMEFLAGHYTSLNKDYLLFGAIFHDIGKVWELEAGRTIQYTDRGRLNGHMLIACELIDEKSKQILGFSDDLRQICKHIVLSHHGKLEYGSPKLPAFPEAMLVHMIDDLDSKMNNMLLYMQEELQTNESDWSSFNQHFEGYLYLPILRNKIQGQNS